MTQELGALTVLPKDQSSVPSPYTWQLKTAYDPSSNGSNISDLCGHIHIEIVKVLFNPGGGGTHLYS